jgi:hypothetical protein
MDLKTGRDENGSGLRPKAVASEPSGFINVGFRPTLSSERPSIFSGRISCHVRNW